MSLALPTGNNPGETLNPSANLTIDIRVSQERERGKRRAVQSIRATATPTHLVMKFNDLSGKLAFRKDRDRNSNNKIKDAKHLDTINGMGMPMPMPMQPFAANGHGHSHSSSIDSEMSFGNELGLGRKQPVLALDMSNGELRDPISQTTFSTPISSTASSVQTSSVPASAAPAFPSHNFIAPWNRERNRMSSLQSALTSSTSAATAFTNSNINSNMSISVSQPASPAVSHVRGNSVGQEPDVEAQGQGPVHDHGDGKPCTCKRSKWQVLLRRKPPVDCIPEPKTKKNKKKGNEAGNSERQIRSSVSLGDMSMGRTSFSVDEAEPMPMPVPVQTMGSTGNTSAVVTGNVVNGFAGSPTSTADAAMFAEREILREMERIEAAKNRKDVNAKSRQMQAPSQTQIAPHFKQPGAPHQSQNQSQSPPAQQLQSQAITTNKPTHTTTPITTSTSTPLRRPPVPRLPLENMPPSFVQTAENRARFSPSIVVRAPILGLSLPLPPTPRLTQGATAERGNTSMREAGSTASSGTSTASATPNPNAKDSESKAHALQRLMSMPMLPHEGPHEHEQAGHDHEHDSDDDFMDEEEMREMLMGDGDRLGVRSSVEGSRRPSMSSVGEGDEEDENVNVPSTALAPIVPPARMWSPAPQLELSSWGSANFSMDFSTTPKPANTSFSQLTPSPSPSPSLSQVHGQGQTSGGSPFVAQMKTPTPASAAPFLSSFSASGSGLGVIGGANMLPRRPASISTSTPTFLLKITGDIEEFGSRIGGPAATNGKEREMDKDEAMTPRGPPRSAGYLEFGFEPAVAAQSSETTQEAHILDNEGLSDRERVHASVLPVVQVQGEGTVTPVPVIGPSTPTQIQEPFGAAVPSVSAMPRPEMTRAPSRSMVDLTFEDHGVVHQGSASPAVAPAPKRVSRLLEAGGASMGANKRESMSLALRTDVDAFRQGVSNGTPGTMNPQITGTAHATKRLTGTGAVLSAMAAPGVSAVSPVETPASPTSPLRRQRSMPTFTTSGPPPPYPEFFPETAQRFKPLPRDEEGREPLPCYSNDLHLVAIMPRKVEFTKPGVQAKDRKWRRVLCVLEGTAFKVYNVNPGVSGVGAIGGWWERKVGVGDVSLVGGTFGNPTTSSAAGAATSSSGASGSNAGVGSSTVVLPVNVDAQQQAAKWNSEGDEALVRIALGEASASGSNPFGARSTARVDWSHAQNIAETQTQVSTSGSSQHSSSHRSKRSIAQTFLHPSRNTNQSHSRSRSSSSARPPSPLRESAISGQAGRSSLQLSRPSSSLSSDSPSRSRPASAMSISLTVPNSPSGFTLPGMSDLTLITSNSNSSSSPTDIGGDTGACLCGTSFTCPLHGTSHSPTRTHFRLGSRELAHSRSSSTSTIVEANQKDLLKTYSLQNAESGLASDYLKRRNVIRVRMEGEQFLLQAVDVAAVVEWIEGLQAATNISLDLDERVMPKGPIFPRRRRRRRVRIEDS